MSETTSVGYGVGASFAVAMLRIHGEAEAAESLTADWKALVAERDQARDLAARYLSEMWKAQSLAEELQREIKAFKASL